MLDANEKILSELPLGHTRASMKLLKVFMFMLRQLAAILIRMY